MSWKLNTASFFCILGRIEKEEKQQKQKMQKLESMVNLILYFS